MEARNSPNGTPRCPYASRFQARITMAGILGCESWRDIPGNLDVNLKYLPWSMTISNYHPKENPSV
jgi:hypothetical protein